MCNAPLTVIGGSRLFAGGYRLPRSGESAKKFNNIGDVVLKANKAVVPFGFNQLSALTVFFDRLTIV